MLQKISSMMFFICIAALLWLIIKLSANYSVTGFFTINFKDVPSDQLLINDSQKVKFTLSTTGFDLLNYYFKPSAKRKVDISLKEVPIHQDNENTYSFNSSYVEEKIANFLGIDKREANLDENRIVFIMEDLASKKVKVMPNINLSFEKQYNKYGNIIVSPDSVTISGPVEILNKLNEIYTDNVILKNINTNIDINVPVELKNSIKADFTSVNIKIDVEKYTESITEVPINYNYKNKLRLFPDKINVRYVVALKDYKNINTYSFHAELDTAEINGKSNFISVYLTTYPNNTKVLSIDPKEVEYIIIEEK